MVGSISMLVVSSLLKRLAFRKNQWSTDILKLKLKYIRHLNMIWKAIIGAVISVEQGTIVLASLLNSFATQMDQYVFDSKAFNAKRARAG